LALITANRPIEAASNQRNKKLQGVTELSAGALRNCQEAGPEGGFWSASTRLSRQILAGFRGFSHSRFGGPGERTPVHSATSLAACSLNPSGCILGDSRQNTKGFLAEVVSRAAPTVSRR